MRCYLVRHGTAAPGPDDPARPLTPGGRAEVEATTRVLLAHRVEVAAIHHSGLARARETAEILWQALAPPGGVHAASGLAPEDDPDVARAELELAAEPLMLVGHLPHLARLAVALVGAARMGEIRFTPGTALGLRRAPGGWEADLVVTPGHGGPS